MSTLPRRRLVSTASLLTSNGPQAFEGLRNAGRKVRRPDCTLVTVDHNIPYVPPAIETATTIFCLLCSTASRKNFKNVTSFIAEADSRAQVEALEDNVKEFGLTYFGMSDKRQGELIATPVIRMAILLISRYRPHHRP